VQNSLYYIILITKIIIKKIGKGEFIINKGTLMTILQLSHMGFELCLLRLQSQTLTTELTPFGRQGL